MEIFWLIISIVAGFFSGCVWLYTHWIKTGDQEYWDETYKRINENRPVEIPEEVVCNILLRLHNISFIILCLSIFIFIVCICSLISK